MEIRPILSALMRNKTGPILVALQVALSLAILANALHIVNERRAAARPRPVRRARDLLHQVRTLQRSGRAAAGHHEAREPTALRAVPGVASVANVSQMPLSRSGSNNSVAVDRKQTSASAPHSTYVSGDSLIKTFGLKLVEGRDFLPQELVDVNENTTTSTPRVIITKPLAEKLWPGARAVGKTMYFGTGEARAVRSGRRGRTPAGRATSTWNERRVFDHDPGAPVYGGNPGNLYASAPSRASATA
jgi:putative ABC transport system permease protein